MSEKIINKSFRFSGDEIRSIESLSVFLSPANGKTKGVVNTLPKIKHIDSSEYISVHVVVERHCI